MVKNSRNTIQKQIIKEEINNKKSFFDAEELQENLKNKGISKATIYRYLQEAKENGEIYSYTCNRRNIYSKGKKSHCHFECEETGKVIHFDIDNIDFLKDKIPGTITSFQIEVKGVCNKCCDKKDHK